MFTETVGYNKEAIDPHMNGKWLIAKSKKSYY
jgi:hypothetical protein